MLDRYKRRGKRILYLDESGFEATTTRQHGLAPKGKRVYGTRIGSIRKRTSLVAAWCNKRIIAPMLFEGTCNTIVFNAWLKALLCKELDHNTVVVMDNAAFHKSAETKKLIENTGATLLLFRTMGCALRRLFRGNSVLRATPFRLPVRYSSPTLSIALSSSAT